jgi:hypothetical protein
MLSIWKACVVIRYDWVLNKWKKKPFNFFYNLKTIGLFEPLVYEKLGFPLGPFRLFEALGFFGLLGLLWALYSTYKKN